MAEVVKNKEKSQIEQIPKESIVVTYKGKKYTIVFPNVLQMLEITRLREQYGNGLYHSLLDTRSIESGYYCNIIEAITFLYVVCDELLVDIGVITKVNGEKSPLQENLSFFKLKPLVDIYVHQILRWYLECHKFFQTPVEDSKKYAEDIKKK